MQNGVEGVQIVYVSKDILETSKENIKKFSEVVLHISSEGSVSQILYLGHSFYFRATHIRGI